MAKGKSQFWSAMSVKWPVASFPIGSVAVCDSGKIALPVFPSLWWLTFPHLKVSQQMLAPEKQNRNQTKQYEPMGTCLSLNPTRQTVKSEWSKPLLCMSTDWMTSYFSQVFFLIFRIFTQFIFLIWRSTLDNLDRESFC